MKQMKQIAFLASPPLKNHLQHNLKEPSIRPPSSPSMCRVYAYLLRATPPRPPNYSLRSPSTTQLAPSTKAGFRNLIISIAILNYISVLLQPPLMPKQRLNISGQQSDIRSYPQRMSQHEPTNSSPWGHGAGAMQGRPSGHSLHQTNRRASALTKNYSNAPSKSTQGYSLAGRYAIERRKRDPMC